MSRPRHPSSSPSVTGPVFIHLFRTLTAPMDTLGRSRQHTFLPPPHQRHELGTLPLQVHGEPRPGQQRLPASPAGASLLTGAPSPGHAHHHPACPSPSRQRLPLDARRHNGARGGVKRLLTQRSKALSLTRDHRSYLKLSRIHHDYKMNLRMKEREGGKETYFQSINTDCASPGRPSVHRPPTKGHAPCCILSEL